jgi:hypothetical protein
MKLILDENSAFHTETQYHYVCWGHSTVQAVDAWGKEPTLKCRYAGNSNFSKSCIPCKGIIGGYLDLEKWQQHENSGVKRALAAGITLDPSKTYIIKDGKCREVTAVNSLTIYDFTLHRIINIEDLPEVK